jgi:chromosome segregation ATPase
MEKINYSDLSNSELKMRIENLKNEFEAKKIKLREICEEMGKIEKEYITANNELSVRKNIYL